MENSITMIKYQGLGNDYLVLDPNKNRVQLQGKKRMDTGSFLRGYKLEEGTFIG